MRNLTDKDIVVSTRVRLARNIAGLPFPKDMSRQNMMMLCDRVEKRVGGNGDFVRINMDDLDKVERTVLVERHLASRELIERPAGGPCAPPVRPARAAAGRGRLPELRGGRNHFRPGLRL